MNQFIKSKSRRGWLAAAVALATAVGGVGLVSRRSERQAQAMSKAEATFWQQQFQRADGTMLPATQFRGHPLVLNFWATWCPPCIEELPLLSSFYQKNNAKGWQVLGLAVDQVLPVQHFLRQTPLTFPVALAGFSGIDLSRSLGNLSGGLPFSVIFDTAGHVVHRKLGRLSETDFLTFEKLFV